MNNNSPIGIFDSGIGGMTVAKMIQKRLPNESMIYFGDTAHLPYGDKSPSTIRHYAARISAWLIEHKVKAVVIACNTASSHAFETVRDICGPNIPVINVIDPVVKHVAESFSLGKIGVIGTKGTIESKVYPRRLKKANSKLQVVSQSTPLLAPMIEEGFFNNTISRSVINSYLSKKTFNELQGLILGCTHYPLIQKEIREHYANDVRVIDSAKVVAEACAQVLEEHNLLCSENAKPEYKFYVSDYTESFKRSTKIFFKKSTDLVEARIWD
jgi:glutamate racemase